jgi:hypothetical protein
VVIGIYRSPLSDVNTFLEKLEVLIGCKKEENTQYYVETGALIY